MEDHHHSRGSVHHIMDDPPHRVIRTVCMVTNHRSNAPYHRMVTSPRGVLPKGWLHMGISEVGDRHPHKDSNGKGHRLQ